MCCHSSPWVSSKMLRVWRSGNAADLIWELQIVFPEICYRNQMFTMFEGPEEILKGMFFLFVL